MTEPEWLACTSPEMILDFLRASYRQLSARKLRLFATRCCENLLNFSTEPEVRQAVATLARFAEGTASDVELWRACQHAGRVWIAEFGCNYVSAAVHETTRLAGTHPFDAATSGAIVAGSAAQLRAGCGTLEGERAAQSDWLRDIFPSPYRPKIVRRSWFRWNDATPRKLAETIYEECAFSLLPVLADALEEAGCTDPDILGHCRGPGPHVRGCWVVDLVLGKA